ncbi:MAG: ATP phosphoribosyltransferase regulatory subunit [Nitrospiraceae bacterium]|nr:ATP phosphoribosyltransferase regulatory subunit [Nitrospiraceae bacterium]
MRVRSAMVSASPKPRSSSGQAASPRERSLVPVGMATILPHAAKQVRRLEEELLDQVNRWGYDEIILPTFEYLDVLAPGLEPELIEHCYQFVDRTTGRTLLLRPDATAQIARTVAMGLTGESLPLRLSYRTSVFRYEQEHAGRGREIFQVGAELIGLDDVTSDSEVIGVMIECLHRIGLQSFKVSLGHVGFIKGLLLRSGLSAQGQKLAEQAAARKDLPRLEEVLASERIAKTAARAIREAPELYGQEEVLARGRVLAAGDPALTTPLERLTQVYRVLCEAGHRDSLLLDLGEFRGFDYYDGVVFDVFAEGIGAELGGGGRYDHLIGRFGRPLPSTGFGLDVDRLFRTVAFPDETSISARVDYLVAAPGRATRLLTDVAAQLRLTRSRVVQRTIKGSDVGLLSGAVEAGLAQQAAAVVVVGAPGMGHEDVLVIESLKTHVPDRRSGDLSRFSKKMALADLVATARRSRRQGKERS